MNTIAKYLENLLDDSEIDRINNRLSNCNSRIIKTNGTIEPLNVSGRLALASLLKNRDDIDRVEYFFNCKWVAI